MSNVALWAATIDEAERRIKVSRRAVVANVLSGVVFAWFAGHGYDWLWVWLVMCVWAVAATFTQLTYYHRVRLALEETRQHPLYLLAEMHRTFAKEES